MSKNKILLSLSALVFLLLVVRLLLFTDVYAVNMIFFDEWAFFDPLFRHGSLWEAFDYQHGPHRMGIGALISNALMEMSGWNTRWNSFAVAITMIFSAGMGVALCIRAGCRPWLSMLFCAVVFLNLRQYEALVGAVNLSHGALPEALLLMICLCWWIRHAFLRSLCLAILTWIMIFTGFGLFAGLVVPAVIAIQGWVEWRQGSRSSLPLHLLALLLIASGWFCFARGYVFQPAVAGFHFPHERPWEYFPFIGLMIAYGVGLSGLGAFSWIMGLLLFVAMVSIGLWASIRLLKATGCEMINQVMVTLTGFTVLFCINAAVGRICLGWDGALASRYIPLMMPGLLGLWIALTQVEISRVWKKAAQSVILIVAALGMLNLHPRVWKDMLWYHDGKLAWRTAYLETRNEKKANELSHFQIYPAEGVITEKMMYLEKNRLNLFSEQSPARIP
jgi:hypothetical protein